MRSRACAVAVRSARFQHLSLDSLPRVGVRRASAYFLYKCFPTQKTVFQRGVLRPMGAF